MARFRPYLNQSAALFLSSLAACLASNSALAQLTSCAAGSVCYYVAIQPIDVCSSTGTGCAAFNNPQFNHTCPVGNPTAISSSNPIGFVDPSSGKDLTRKIWNQVGLDISYFPMQQWNNGGYQTVTLLTDTTSDVFTQMTQTPFSGSGTAPPLNSDAHVLNMFFVKTLVPATSGTLYGFSWLGRNGIVISQTAFCPPYPVTPRYDNLAHELGHNLGLNHLDIYNFGFGTSPTAAPASDLMTQGSDRTEPASTSNALTQLGNGEGKGTADQLDCNSNSASNPCALSTNEPSFQRGEVSSSGFLHPIGSSTTIGTATAPTTTTVASVTTNSTTAATSGSAIYFDTTGPAYTDSNPLNQPSLTLLGLVLTIGPTLDFDKKNRVDLFAGGNYVAKFSYDTGKAGDPECPISGTQCVIINLTNPGLPQGNHLTFSQGILNELKTAASFDQLVAAPTTITYKMSDGSIITRQMTGSTSMGQVAANSQTPGNETTPMQMDPVVFAAFMKTVSSPPAACSKGVDPNQPGVTFQTDGCPNRIIVDGNPTTDGGQLAGTAAIRSCTPSGSLAALLQRPNVTAYVPNGAWEYPSTGVQVVPIEPAGGTPTSISTPQPVNSCASNSTTGATVCTANNTDVYLLSTMSTSVPDATLTSGATAYAGFTGGSCQNCGVAINQVGSTAVISIGLSAAPSGTGIQFLDLASNTFSTPIAAANHVSEGLQWDPSNNLILSPNEGQGPEGRGVYDLFNTSSPSATPELGNPVYNLPGGGVGTTVLDSAAEDCTTGIALASDEFTNKLYLANLMQATFSPGSPGMWTAPQQFLSFPEFNFLQFNGAVVGTNGIAVAPGSHFAIVAGEFGGNRFGVVQLPPSPVTGTPSIIDYVAASLPNTPDGKTWTHGLDPHTITAYVSPNDGKAYALLADLPSTYNNPEGSGFRVTSPPTYLAVVDFAGLLGAPRTGTGSHTVSPYYNLTSNGVVRYVATRCGEAGAPC